LSPFRLVVDHVDVLLAEGLDQAVTNAAFLDDERSDSISLLHLDNLLLQPVERKSARMTSSTKYISPRLSNTTHAE
jgi:hypothetical protein